MQDLINNSIIKMLDDGEFEKIYKFSKGRKEKKKVLNDRTLAKLVKENKVNKIPTIVLIHDLESATVLKDLLGYMIKGDIKCNS